MDFQNKHIERDIATSTEVSVGDTVTVTTTVTEQMVDAFAELTGDTNPFHTDEEMASDSPFGGRIAHGALVNAFISTALANYPGDVIYKTQQSSFVAAVYLGDTITARCEVVEEVDDGDYRVETTILGDNGGEAVTGEAIVSIR